MASKFESAFAAARKSGKKEFSFGGKSYNTKLKKDDSGPKNVPTPKARPVGAKASASTGSAGAKASTKAEPKSKKIFSLDKPKSYTERSKESAPAKKTEPKGDGKIFTLKKTASYADRNKEEDKKSKKITTGGGGGY